MERTILVFRLKLRLEYLGYTKTILAVTHRSFNSITAFAQILYTDKAMLHFLPFRYFFCSTAYSPL